MVKLFEKIVFRGVELSNRIVVSPMGMYSAENGYVTPFHLVHYGKFAMGGAGQIEDFSEVLEQTDADAVAAANIFQYFDQSVYLVKKDLYEKGLNVRNPDLFLMK